MASASNDRLTAVDQYVTDLFAPEDEALVWIRTEADRNELPTISVGPHEGRLLQVLMRSVGARKAVEIGTLAGYSGVWLARALPAGGKLFTLEKSSKHAKVARASFERAGVADKVELLEGSALDSLQKLGPQAPFDFVFIDANKNDYPQYLQWTVDHLRPGGMVVAHNALRGGRILTPTDEDEHAIREFNDALAHEKRLDSSIIVMGDGIAIGVKTGH